MSTVKAAWLLNEVGNESMDAFGQWRGYKEKNVVLGISPCRYRMVLNVIWYGKID